MGDWLEEKGAVLRLELGFDGYMPEVFCYLFENKVYRRVRACSANEVFRGIRSFQRNHQPTLKNKNATEKGIRQALDDLRSLGVVEKVSPETVGVPREGGRHPNALYKLRNAANVNATLKARLETKTRKLVEIFQELEDIEFAATGDISRGGVRS